MNIDAIKDSHEEMQNLADGLRSLGHLVQIASNSAESINLDGLGKLLISMSVSCQQQYEAIYLGLYDRPPEHC